MAIWQQNELSAGVVYDAASALCVGRRERQEDALVHDFPVGSGCGFVVLSDGMGGHAAGGKASKIAVTEVFSELLFQREDEAAFGADVKGVLLDAVQAANCGILAQSAQDPGLAGMGATLVVPVFLGCRLHWISIGDSPLYLFRDGRLKQLNEDHSLAPQIDLMVEHGLIDSAEAAFHPDRNCLTSALGGPDISRIDCPDSPTDLRDGDVILVASDGLQFLADPEIERVMAAHAGGRSADLVRALMEAVSALEDPDQDNISISAVRISIADPDARTVEPVEAGESAPAPERERELELEPQGLVASCLSLFGTDRRPHLVRSEGS